MKKQVAFTTLIFAGLLLSGFEATAAPRIPFTCEYASGAGQNGYEMFQLQGFISTDHTINYYASATDANGKEIFSQNQKKAPYQINANGIAFDLIPGQSASLVQISKDLLQVKQDVFGVWQQRKIQCGIVTQELNQTLPKAAFELFGGPVVPSGARSDILVKSFHSSDTRVVIEASLYPDIPATRHYAAVPSQLELKVRLRGVVTSNTVDDASAIGYILYGASKNTVETRVSNPADIAQLIQLMKAPVRTLNVLQDYGNSTPVTVLVDCSTQQVCVLTAHN